MQYENVIKDFEDLPEIAKKEVADFIAFFKNALFRSGKGASCVANKSAG